MLCPEVRAGREGDSETLGSAGGPPGCAPCSPSEHPRRGGEERSAGGSTWVETCLPSSFLLVVETAHGLPERLLLSKADLDGLGVGFPGGKSGRKAGRVATEKGAPEVLGALKTHPRECERRGGEGAASFLVGPGCFCCYSRRPPKAVCFHWSPTTFRPRRAATRVPKVSLAPTRGAWLPWTAQPGPGAPAHPGIAERAVRVVLLGFQGDDGGGGCELETQTISAFHPQGWSASGLDRGQF